MIQGEEEFDNGDMIGVVKIKDGLFICDEYGAQVSKLNLSYFRILNSLLLIKSPEWLTQPELNFAISGKLSASST